MVPVGLLLWRQRVRGVLPRRVGTWKQSAFTEMERVDAY